MDICQSSCTSTYMTIINSTNITSTLVINPSQKGHPGPSVRTKLGVGLGVAKLGAMSSRTKRSMLKSNFNYFQRYDHEWLCI